MDIAALVMLLVFAGGAAAIIFVATLARANAAPAGMRVASKARREWRIAQVVRWGFAAITAVSLLVYPVITTTDHTDIILMVSPSLVAVSYILGAWVSERWISPPPISDRGSVSTLSSPDQRDQYAYGPRWLWGILAVEVVLIGVLFVFAYLTSGRAIGDTSISYLQVAGGALTCTTGPYPGPHYSVPMATSLFLLATVLFGALRSQVKTPAGYGISTQHEEGLKRQSLVRSTACAGFAVSLTLWIVAFLMDFFGPAGFISKCLASNGYEGTDIPGWVYPLGTFATVTAWLSAIATAVFLVLLFRPVRMSYVNTEALADQ
ncbi:hypothetical protein ACFSYH_07520 [Populibacterium corticicola]|uniref:Uncharacterized protein n=1 Tax=Populibacterium corticicola TaxID=1812826 RepID=A0ABW5XDM5_9MICO